MQPHSRNITPAKLQATRNPTPMKYEPVPLFETNSDIRKKSYRDVWKRALIKIKFQQILLRVNTSSLEKKIEMPAGTQELLRTRAFSSTNIGIKRIQSFIIMPYYVWYLAWLLLLCILMLYMTTYSMFNTSFIGFTPESNEANFEVMIDIIFCIDIIFSFNLAYFDEFNNLVTNRNEIIKRYFYGDFAVDLILTFPTGILGKAVPDIQYSNIFQYRFLFRILKWLILKKRFNFFYFFKALDEFQSNHRSIIQFFSILTTVFLTTHVTACTMFLASRSYDFSHETWAFKSGVLNYDLSYQYTTCLYWALTTMGGIGYGDNVPYTDEEKLLCMCFMSLGIYIISSTAGLFTAILNKILEKDIMIDENYAYSVLFCHTRHIPKRLASRLHLFVKSGKIVYTNKNFFKFLGKLELNFRYEIALDVYEQAVTRVPYIMSKDKYFVSIFTFSLKFLVLEKGDSMWSKFAYADGIYFISKGQAKFSYNGEMFIEYEQGDYFGDVEVFLKVERKFDAAVVAYSNFLQISNDGLMEMKVNFPEEFENLKVMAKKRKNVLIDVLARKILRRKGLSALEKNSIDALIYDLKKRLKKQLFRKSLQKIYIEKLEELQAMNVDTKFRIYRTKELIRHLLEL